MSVVSTPSSPAALERQIGPLALQLTAEGLTIRGLPRGPVALTVIETLALFDFARTAGVRQLANRAWLAEQFELGQDRAAIDAAEAGDR